MFKRISSFVATLILSLSSLFVFAPAVHAVADTCTWAGGGVDDNFSTAANWTGCDNGTVPESGDSLVFNNEVPGGDAIYVNDLVGASFNTITFSGNATASQTMNGNAFTLTGGLSASAPVLVIISNAVTLSGNQTISTSSDYTVRLTGALSGSGNLTKTGVGLLNLQADNSSYTGALSVNAGKLYFNHVNALGAISVGTTVASGATLGFYGFNADATVAEPLTLSGDETNASLSVFQSYGAGGGSVSPPYPKATFSGAVTLTSNVKVNLDYKDLKLTGSCSGAYTITVGSGSTGVLDVASSPNTCNTSGVQEVAAKTTEYKDNSPATSIFVSNKETAVVTGTYGDTSVDSGGILKGTGKVGALTVGAGGTVAPGLSPGCLNTGDVLFYFGSTYDFELGGTTACTEYDQINATGTVTLNPGVGAGTGPTLNTMLVNGFKPVAGQTFTIINNDGTDAVLNGTFNNLAEGATFTVDGYVLKISYVGGDGNDVVLTVVSVPAVPNTGFKLLLNNPLLTIASTTFLAGAMLVVAKKYQRATRR